MRERETQFIGLDCELGSCGCLSLIPHVKGAAEGTPGGRGNRHKYSERNRNERWRDISLGCLTVCKFSV